MKFSASCLPGMEELLTAELKELGADQISPGRQAVSFQGDTQMLLNALNQLRSALRVFHVISRLPHDSEGRLYAGLKKISWKKYLKISQNFAIQALESGGKAPASLRYITLKTKDIIVDSLRTPEGRRPSVDRNNPDISFTVLFQKNDALLLRDAAGTPLSQRGYRKDHTGAPLNEALAWGILRLSGFYPRKGPGILVDPMCGSGTFSIEAARYLKDLGIPPHAVQGKAGENRTGAARPDPELTDPKQPDLKQPDPKPADPTSTDPESGRPKPGHKKASGAILVKKKAAAGRDFMCYRWPDVGEQLISASRKRPSPSVSSSSAAENRGGGSSAQTQSGPNTSGGSSSPWRIIASDLDPRAIQIARRNASRAGVEEYIEFYQSDFHSLHESLDLPGSREQAEKNAGSQNREPGEPSATAATRMMILNPPYDMRLQVDDARDFYSRLGDSMKRHWKGYKVHIFSANRDALKHVGLRPDTKLNLKNGQLNAGLYSYSLY
ncbi:THUMP domain-containing class I SAM-dependent RNA methyltransferase [Salinispira pacifica]|uniref:THUMP domain-containing protein n=1 Tax=Salinispira pacifica TaxID=1307761 RepID=V5WJH6_9SPIO|nr:THUMP domain-containing protein [Salinispira pacifica]AHC15321.1 hypothetical protein L21SP2_1950 [Salinispira pacifica]